MSESVIMVLQGGLGNQLFQYCAGLAISSQLGGELWLTPVQEDKHSGRDYRQTLYKRGKAIGIDGNPSSKAQISRIQSDSFKQQMEAFSAWSPSDYRGHESIALKGYYQYLPAIESQISLVRDDILQSLSQIRTQLRLKYQIYNPRQTSFLHVRRGDYLKANPNVFWVHDETYFLYALQAMKQRTSGPRRWIVLSDDVEWCKSQPWLKVPPFEIVDEPDQIYGMMLMSLCEGGAIISNSTYSWWGAMLGSGALGATVVYPEKWIGEDTPNIFPRNWIGV